MRIVLCTRRAVCKITHARLTHWYKKTRLVYIHTRVLSEYFYSRLRCTISSDAYIILYYVEAAKWSSSIEYCTVHVRRRIWMDSIPTSCTNFWFAPPINFWFEWTKWPNAFPPRYRYFIPAFLLRVIIYVWIGALIFHREVNK